MTLYQDAHIKHPIRRYRRLILASTYHRIRRGKLDRHEILDRVYTRIETDRKPPFLGVEILKGQVRCYVDERLPLYTQNELFN